MCKKIMVPASMAVAAVFVKDASAGTFTYDIVNYPAYETDITTGGTDTISGTIITNTNTGTLSTSDIVGGTYTIANPTFGSSTYPVLGNVSLSGLDATPTQLLLPEADHPTGDNYLYLTPSPPPFDSPYPNILYSRDMSQFSAITDEYQGGINLQDPGTVSLAMYFNQWFNQTPLAGADPWVIATAIPEPATLTLLGSALLGLGVVYLRRRTR